jgi:hypothetical protein
MIRNAVAAVIFSTAVIAETNELKVVTSSSTHPVTRQVKITDVFTRGGSTNLVRRTSTKDGIVQIRLHDFQHAGTKVALFVSIPGKSSGITIEPDIPYTVTVEFDATNHLNTVVIGKGGLLLDAYRWTNGVFQPVESSFLQKVNAIGSDMEKLFDPEKVRSTTPEKFSEDVQNFIKKHKED